MVDERPHDEFDPVFADVPEVVDPSDRPHVSHAGLATIDPWGVGRPWHHAVWPWGLSGVAEALEVVALALIMFLAVRFVAHNYVVDGGSMRPTFEDGEFVIVNRIAYRTFDLSWVPGLDVEEWQPFGDPKPGDVIVFTFSQQPRTRDFIKRVIGIPGQTVSVVGGVVTVDGVALDEPYIASPPEYEMPPIQVPEGKLLVLGDNRNNSFDSHSFGLIDQSSVIGRAEVRYWPLDRFTIVGHTIGSASPLLGVARLLATVELPAVELPGLRLPGLGVLAWR